MRNLKWLKSSYVAMVMVFLYAPIAVLITYSFNANKSRGAWTGFTLDWYGKLFQNDAIISAFGNTLLVAAISSVVATLVGTAAAIGINSLNSKAKQLVRTITYLPIINPDIITGVSLMLLFVFAREKMNIPINAGYLTLILAHITFNIPYVIFNVMPKLRQLDQFTYEAALDLGCTPWQAFRKVIIPEISPAIFAGFLMALTMSMDDFVISYFTTGPASQTLPIRIYAMTRRRISPEINALSTIVFVVVLTVLLISYVSEGQKERKLLRQERETRQALHIRKEEEV
ncbi:MAG: ABC transporter permease [Negativicutes bacterium]|nr:ABC transporter permease [Negativicutes bacterium]